MAFLRNTRALTSDDAMKENQQFVAVIEQIAQRKGMSPAQLALAWVLK